MNRAFGHLAVITVILASLLICSPGLATQAAPPAPGDRLALSGFIKTSTGKGVKEAAVEVLVNGQPVKPAHKEGHLVTSKQGGFVTDLVLPAGTLPGARVDVQAHKPSWMATSPIRAQVAETGTDAAGNRLFQATVTLTLQRAVTPAFWIATLILLLVYVIISFEWLHRTLAALLGAALLLFITYSAGVFDPSF
jgi:hypothetical protein